MANSITQPLHSKSLFKERYTTPVPNAATTYFYDLSNDEIIVPCNQWYKMSSGGGKIYLHFLFFKKTYGDSQISIGVQTFIKYHKALILRKRNVA